MSDTEENNLTYHSPYAMMARWIDTLGQINGHDNETMLVTCDYDKEHKLQHIKATHIDKESWEKHFRKKEIT